MPVGTNGITTLGTGENSILVNEAPSPIPESSIAVTPNGTLIAAGNFSSDTNGTVFLLTGQGGLLWGHHVDSGVLSEALLPNGTAAAYVTDSNALSTTAAESCSPTTPTGNRTCFARRTDCSCSGERAATAWSSSTPRAG